MPTPAFLPLSVTLMGHQNLGTVRGRWLDGGRLELDDGAIYGPGAVFSARPVVEAKPSRGALVWVEEPTVWLLTHAGGGRYGESPYDAHKSCNAVAYRTLGAVLNRDIQCQTVSAAIAQITTWAREDGYTVPPWPGEEPAPVVEPESVRVMGAWDRGRDGSWVLISTKRHPLAHVDKAGAVIHISPTRESRDSRLTGIAGRRWAMNELLNDGWELGAVPMVELLTAADIKPGQVHHYVDGSRRVVEHVTTTRILYDDHTWIWLNLTDIAAKVECIEDADIPF